MNLTRNFATCAFAVVLASTSSAASYLSTSVGSFSLTYGPSMFVTLGGVPTVTATQTGTGAAFASSTGVFTSPVPYSILFPNTIGGNWNTSASGSSGADGTATSLANFVYTITLTNLSPTPNAYRLSFNFSDFASFSAPTPTEDAKVSSTLDADQLSFTAGNTTFSDVIYLSKTANGPGAALPSAGASTFSAIMLPLQTDTLTIDVSQDGFASNSPAGAPEPSPLFLGVLGLGVLAKRRLASKRAAA
jgi:hypothetical protein